MKEAEDAAESRDERNVRNIIRGPGFSGTRSPVIV
jgi:hypothetical protein